jgi:hypothetical protein
MNNESNSQRDNLNEDNTSRPILSQRNISKNLKNDEQNNQTVINKLNCTNMEKNLLRIFQDEFLNVKQLGYIRIISFELFREIMFVYFYNNIVLFLRAFKDIITDIDLDSYEDDIFIEKIKVIQKNNKNFRLDLMSDQKINSFLNKSFDELFMIRNNLTRSDNVKFTFDDIYVYMKRNFYFYNCITLYETYISKSLD